MEEKEKPYNDLLARVEGMRAKWQKKTPDKKKKRGAWLLMINVLILGLLVFFMFQSKPERTRYHTLIKYSGIAYRLSITHDESAKTLGITLTLKNEQTAERRLGYDNPVAVVVLRYADVPVHSIALGEGVREIVLKPNDSRVFTQTLGERPLRSFAESTPEAVTPKRQTLFSGKRHVPITAELSLRTREPVSTYLDFKYVID